MELTRAIDDFLLHIEGRGGSLVHLKKYQFGLAKLSDLGVELVGEVGAKELHELSRSLKKDNGERYADATMAGFHRAWKSFFAYCEERGWVEKSPARRLKPFSYLPKRDRSAPSEDAAAVLACLDQFVQHRNTNPRDVRDALIVSLSFASSGRLGEFWSLEKRAVINSLKRPRRVSVITGGAVSEIPVYEIVGTGKRDDAVLMFYEYESNLFNLWLNLIPDHLYNVSPFVFVSLATGRQLHKRTLSAAFDRICAFAGVPIFYSHAVRKRNVTDMLRDGIDLKTVSRIVNHANPLTTMRHYASVDRSDAQKAGGRLAARHSLQRKNDDLVNGFFAKIDPPD